ncbi:amidohydrolase [Desulfogranum marinum]|uniref:amidohydrolase n=1 Tax=Desulfogranum marinum TaxID=453220 RepID=UPI001E5368AC|nr:amidohydrolase [Desulfogranum marinum]
MQHTLEAQITKKLHPTTFFMTIDLLIKNCHLVPDPAKNESIPHGFIAIKDERIVQTGPMDQCPEPDKGTVIDGQGHLAMSGLVNGHCHAPMTLFRGMADDLVLSSWLNEHIFPAEAKHVSPEMAYWCSKLAAAEMLLSGTTTVADAYFFEEEVSQAFLETGIRAMPAQAIIDFPAPGVPDPAKALHVAEAFIDSWTGKTPLITPALFAHSPYTCCTETLVHAKKLARQKKVPFFIHLAETADEIQHIHQAQGATPVQHLEAIGVLDTHTVCVHAVWVNAKDIDILDTHGCSVISCPQSNLKLASGIAPVPLMLKKGMRVGLGTDGCASNNTLDMFREMDICAKIQKLPALDPVGIPAENILHAATIGGAQALGMDGDIGALIPGNIADIILLDIQNPQLQPFYTANTLVYSGSASTVRSVIVHGQLVVHNRELLTFDLNETKEHVRTLAEQIK